MKRLIFLALLSSIFVLGMSAQESGDGHSHSIRPHVFKRYSIFFNSGISDIDYAYQRNGDILFKMKEDIDATLDMDHAYPDSLLILSSSSPDGDAVLNKKLARERAANVRRVLLQMFPELEKSVIVVGYHEANWDGLEQVLKTVSGFPQAEEMLSIINSGMDETRKEEALRACAEGWDYLVANHLYSLRTSSVTLKVTFDGRMDEYVLDTPDHQPIVVQEDVAVSEPDPQHQPQPQPEDVDKKMLVGLKTNLLYDAAVVPNLGLEFYLGKRWSLVGNWMYSWWHSDPDYFCWRTYGGDLAVRRWFGKASKRKALTGHHVGLYGQMLTYDFLMGQDGILADDWNWAAGLEYGYSAHLSRRLNLDFTVGAGYHWGEYDEYITLDEHYVWQATKRRRFIGPTKVEISLVWLIGGSDKLPAKGGKR